MNEYDEIKRRREAANFKGYGKTISSEVTTLTILCESGHTYKVRHKDKGKDWSIDTELHSGERLSFPMASTEQISLNGGGDSDDININDDAGYIEYKYGIQSDFISKENLWTNLVTWNPHANSWLLNPVFDSIDKHDGLLVPVVSGAECIITLLKDHDFGRPITNDFTILRIINNTSHTFPVKVRKYGEWLERDSLKACASSDFDIWDIDLISLNGDRDSDDIKINYENGYIEFTPAKFEDIKLWITQFWWNPTVQKWYGSASESSINGHDHLILEATAFDTETKTITLTISESK